MAIFRCERPFVEGIEIVSHSWRVPLGWGNGLVDSYDVARRHGIPHEAVEKTLRAHPEYGKRITEVKAQKAHPSIPGDPLPPGEEGAASAPSSGFSCPHCDRTFDTEHGLQVHVGRKHGEG